MNKRWEIEQLGSSFTSIFLVFPMKVARGHALGRAVIKARAV